MGTVRHVMCCHVTGGTGIGYGLLLKTVSKSLQYWKHYFVHFFPKMSVELHVPFCVCR